MAEFKISRIRYTWRNVWANGVEYIKDDVVKFGGSAWICVRQHTSSAFATDQLFYANINDTDPTPAWIKMADGYTWKGTWTTGHLYSPGDLSLYGGVVYLCVNSHTAASTFAPHETDWVVYTSMYNWSTDWALGSRYGVGDVVRYGGKVYKCVVEHTAGATLESTQSNWQLLYSGVDFVGDWAPSTAYKENDLVKFGGTILRCNTGHSSGALLTTDNAKWTTEFPGVGFRNEWSSSVQYSIGDLVLHGGYLFRSLSNNVNKNPGDSIYENYISNSSATPDWAIAAKGTNFRGTWDPLTSYKTGDLVNRGGQLYVAILDSTSDGSTLDYLDTSNWKIVVPGYNWKNSWADQLSYAVGDIVSYEGTSWICNQDHFSTDQNYPSLDNGSGYFYWDILVLSGGEVGTKERGDLLTFDLSDTAKGDTSSLGITNLPIGREEKLLTIDNEDSLYYKTWGTTQYLVHVAPHGVDDEFDAERGFNYFKPWASIRFACERIEALGINQTTNVKIRVWTGRYEEILPIIVPANVAIQGDEVRSVSVVAAKAIPALDADKPYTVVALDRVNVIISDILSGNLITKTIGNNEEQVVLTTTTVTNVPFVPARFDLLGNEIFQSSTVTVSPLSIDIQVKADITNLINDINDYLDFYIESGDVDPVITGTNTATTSQGYINSVSILTANRNFIAAEAAAFIKETYPTYAFNEESCKRDIRRFVDAFIYDITYTGNYKSILAARYYRNAILGCEGEDMFYVRNATGIRNMTLSGLVGSVNPPGVYELYQRPTGGAYVSLDPGWGPDDERVWITSRSCYVQNCATFGSGAVGQKLDGSLHNGGYKSMVSNDFTQLISDGIGAWVLNGARAELVSVFSYYAQIGMFAESGGIIRSTNGNSSYGNYGVIADGNDPAEIPTYGKVNTRTSEASVAAAFAGEVNDEILILEFKNAGQDYTSATYSFVGSGTMASVVQEEFRDNAVFQALVRNAPGDAGATEGAGGYTLIGNNAQRGDTLTVTIATNDTHTEEQLLGLRIIITSGDGTGQYGYVQAFNEITKVVTVYRESDDQPGWDHVVPGYGIVTTMTTNATYKFEPRPIFDAPPYSATSIDFGVGTSWANIVYGETTETFTNVQGSAGTGVVIGDDGLVPVPALWNITKVGRHYTVTVVDRGAGYAQGQSVVIEGSFVGGIDGENDILIVVKSVSDDSTNSIQSFEYVGFGVSGRFVATPLLGTSAVSSIDGETWEPTSLSSSGVWKALAWGDNKFISIRFNSDRGSMSLDGVTWSEIVMPEVADWTAVAYGGGVWLAVASNGDKAAFSEDGINWTSTTIPDIGDSSFNEWIDIAYGKGQFVALATSGNFVAVGTYSSGTMNWVTSIMDIIADSSTKEWTSIAYGNQRWVVMSGTGESGYSLDGLVWNPITMPTQDGSTIMHWNKVRYGQGVFFAVCDTASRDVAGDPTTGDTTFAATSYDGIVWTGRELATPQVWSGIAFGNPDITLGDSTSTTNSTPMWIAISNSVTSVANKISTGARALGRIMVEGGNITEVRMWEPGSGYTTAPRLTIIDPSNTQDAYIEQRMGDAVLAQPTWLNRGSRYKTSTTVVTVTGDGFADVVPFDKNITLSGLTVVPGPGAQFRFRGESKLYTVVVVELDSEQIDGTHTATFQISPYLTLDDAMEHDAQVEIRERYSQVRITGHDFLDIGTGNFVDSNYPQLYSANTYITTPEQEVYETNGGRVFYTSTDQSGNFRTGELFAVEQATGIVTISADFFDLQGLNELALGGVRLGGSGAVVREFSTDPTFTADSNNVVPTQRAIKAYLQSRLNVGGSELQTAAFIAGTVKVGPNLISNVAGLEIIVPVQAYFPGTSQLSGSILAQDMFFKSFKDRT